MKRLTGWVFVAGLFVSLPAFGAEESMTPDDLRSSANWTAISTQVINYVTNEWVDPAGFSEPARFYRIDKIH